MVIVPKRNIHTFLRTPEGKLFKGYYILNIKDNDAAEKSPDNAKE